MIFTENTSLKDYTTFGVEVSARYFASFSDESMLREIVRSQEWKDNKHYILGGGSNILFTEDFDGVVIKNDVRGVEIVKQDDDFVWVRVGSGESWHEFVLWAVNHQYWGIENLALIPGTVGAAPVQNIGAYGVEAEETIHSVEVFDLESGDAVSLLHDECEFGYRNSIFKQNPDRYVVIQVVFQLKKKGKPRIEYGSLKNNLDEQGIVHPTLQNMVDTVMSVRRSKLPDVGEIGMAGSFFKNPVIDREHFETLQKQFPDILFFELDNGMMKIPAGWLIETLGYRGAHHGNVGTYDKHALVLVNHGGATGKQVWDFAQKIMHDVYETFHITLEPEVLIV